jgi:hypothetical protein
MADLKSLPSVSDLAAGLHDQMERAARKQAAEEARAKAAQAQEEAAMKAREPFQILHKADVRSPDPAFVMEGSDGELYGSCVSGRFASGILFRMRPDGSNFEILHTFEGPEERLVVNSLIIAKDGTLYGSTTQKFQLNNTPAEGNTGSVNASLFMFVPATREFTVLYSAVDRRDGWKDVLSRPEVSAATPEGILYGKCDDRMVFRFSTKERVLDVILDATWTICQFRKDGSQTVMLFGQDSNHQVSTNPKQYQTTGSLLLVGDRLYTVTEKGGRADQGKIASLGLNGEDYRTVYDFASQSPEGCNPSRSLVLGPNNMLYGICEEGAAQGKGSIFSINLNGENCRPILTFNHDIYPGSLLALDGQGSLYFWITRGRLELCRMQINNRQATALYRNSDDTGASPTSLVCGHNQLYGTLGANVFSFRLIGDSGFSQVKPNGQNDSFREDSARRQVASEKPTAPLAQPAADTDEVRAPTRNVDQEATEDQAPSAQGIVDAEQPPTANMQAPANSNLAAARPNINSETGSGFSPGQEATGASKARFILTLNSALDNHDWQTLTRYTLNGMTNYFGHNRATNAFIRRDMEGDARNYRVCSSRPELSTFRSWTTNDGLTHDEIELYTEALEVSGKQHHAHCLLEVIYEPEKSYAIYSLELRVIR